MQKILKYIRKADEDFHLIENNDTIVIGISGGKDSVLLAHALNLYRKFKEKNFKIIAVHMNMGFPDSDMSVIKNYITSLNIPYHEVEVPIYEILQNYKKDGNLDCARCSNLKRGAIVNIAKELKANKIAFAHHGDDAIETFMMNAIYSGKMSTFQPKIFYEDNNITFIRPLIYLHEKNIIQVVKRLEIPFVKSGCPKDGYSSRTLIKQKLNEFYAISSNAQKNLLHMLSEENGIWKKE